jgi:S1-C subfamily serine protease
VVSNLDPSSPAAQTLQPGDVIEGINKHPVNSVADFNRLAGEAKGQTLLRVNRQGNGAYVVISPSDSGGDDNQ